MQLQMIAFLMIQDGNWPETLKDFSGLGHLLAILGLKFATCAPEIEP